MIMNNKIAVYCKDIRMTVGTMREVNKSNLFYKYNNNQKKKRSDYNKKTRTNRLYRIKNKQLEK